MTNTIVQEILNAETPEIQNVLIEEHKDNLSLQDIREISIALTKKIQDTNAALERGNIVLGEEHVDHFIEYGDELTAAAQSTSSRRFSFVSDFLMLGLAPSALGVALSTLVQHFLGVNYPGVFLFVALNAALMSFSAIALKLPGRAGGLRFVLMAVAVIVMTAAGYSILHENEMLDIIGRWGGQGFLSTPYLPAALMAPACLAFLRRRSH